MSTNPIKHYSLKEYFEIEKASDIRHEYFYGEIFAMSGASEKHNSIAVNICAEIQQYFKRNSILTCKAYMSEMRTKINNQLYRYPDVVVGCNVTLEVMEGLETLTNPVLIVEVLSRSTAKFDREAKFREYQQIESLQYYLLVNQNSPQTTLFTKQDDSWINNNYVSLNNIIELPLINCQLLMSDIYWNIEFNN
ncbi:MAG: Uma2 family endonuclease [Blastocatellia bacterium]